tara:strand:+ start:1906 stop:2682 length:777 start_codon:yes stop_codon:yes gene_type:complete
MAELDRDCVDLGSGMPACEDRLQMMCQHLVRHMLEWPLLKTAMEKTLDGCFTDISCSHSFFYVSFPRKVYLAKRNVAGMLEQRPVKELLMYLSMEIAQWMECDRNWSQEELIVFLKSLDVEKVVYRVTRSGEDPFWFMKYDMGTVTHVKSMSHESRILNAIRSLIDEKNIQRLICRINDDIPNLEAMFGATPSQTLEQTVLAHTFEKNGFVIQWNWTTPQLSLRPIRFPTIWIAPVKPSSRLEYQMIGFVQKKFESNG